MAVKKSRLLYLPIETLHRELVSKLLLSFVAAEAGFVTVVGEQSRLRKSVVDLPPGILLESACDTGKSRADFFSDVHSAGHKITSSDEEAVSIYSLPQQWCQNRIEKRTFDKIDKFFSWGPEQSEIMQDYLGFRSKKIDATGSYRLDAWQPQMAKLHENEVRNIRNGYGKFILIPSNFPSRHIPQGAQSLLDKWTAMDLIDGDKGVSEFWELMAHRNKICDAFIDALPHISEAFPDHGIIIRPHPVEGVLEWRDSVRHLDRVQVVYDGEVTPWLLAADAIMHHSCTTALEARQFGLSPITYRPFRNEKLDDSFLCDMGPNAADIDTLINLLGLAIEGNWLDYPMRKRMDKFLTSSADELASDRIIRALSEFDTEEQTLPIDLSVHMHRFREKFRPESAKKISRATKSRAKTTNAPSKWPGLHTDEINRILGQLRHILGRFEHVKVKDFRRRMFMIYSDT